MAKPRKKYNRNAALAREIDRSLKDCFVLFAQEMGENGLRFCLDGKLLTRAEWKIHAKRLELLHKVPHHWTMITGVLCRTPNGKEFIDYQDMVTTQRHYYEDLDSLASQAIRSFYQRNNKEHILTCFYIGIPNQIEMSEAQIIDLLYALGANKLNSWYERSQLLDKAVAELATVPMADWLPKPIIQALAKHDITHFGQIRKLGQDGLIELKGIGEKRLTAIYKGFHDMAQEQQENLPHFIQFQMDEVHRDETQAYFKRLEKRQ